MSQNLSEGPTGELFELQPGRYQRLLAGSQENVYAVPPSGERSTKCYITGDSCLCPPGQTCPHDN